MEMHTSQHKQDTICKVSGMHRFQYAFYVACVICISKREHFSVPCGKYLQDFYVATRII